MVNMKECEMLALDAAFILNLVVFKICLLSLYLRYCNALFPCALLGKYIYIPYDYFAWLSKDHTPQGRCSDAKPVATGMAYYFLNLNTTTGGKLGSNLVLLLPLLPFTLISQSHSWEGFANITPRQRRHSAFLNPLKDNTRSPSRLLFSARTLRDSAP